MKIAQILPQLSQQLQFTLFLLTLLISRSKSTHQSLEKLHMKVLLTASRLIKPFNAMTTFLRFIAEQMSASSVAHVHARWNTHSFFPANCTIKFVLLSLSALMIVLTN